MSLLDPNRDPHEVWIALRTDSQRGSGTVSDPFHGGMVEAPPLRATLSLVVGTDPRAIVATSDGPHGYIEGDIVVFSETRDANGAPAPSFDGPYQIYLAGLPSNQFKCLLDFPATTSLTGTALAVKRTFLLDEVLRSLTQEYVAIHFGPGVFETRGNAGSVNASTQGWRVRRGWKIRGSGIDVTTIKLASVRGGPNLYLYLAIGPQSYDQIADYSEVSDLTIDCNAQGNSTLTVGALALIGSHTRARRVRAIHWGSGSLAAEAFVISLAGQHPHPLLANAADCVIEDCIAEHPGLNNVRESTIMGFIGVPALAEVKPTFFRGCAMRRNFVDATYSRNEVPVQSITLAGAVATVTTPTPHGRSAGDWVVIAGAIVDGTELNNFNGSYQISNVTDATFEYTPQPATPASNATGTMFVDRFSSHYVPAGDGPPCIVSTSDPSHPNQFRLTTLTPHNRIPSDNVRISGVYVSVPPLKYANAFNASHLVEAVPSPTELIFTVYPTNEDPGTIKWLPDPSDANYSLVFIGLQFHVGGGGGTCQVVEHNRVIGATMGMYGDSFSTRSLHVRNNYFHNVRIGVFRNLGNYLSPPAPNPVYNQASSLTRNGTTATFQTLLRHFLEDGQIVRVQGALVAGSPLNPFNGDHFTVTSVGLTFFTYEMSDVPAASASGDISYSGKDVEGVLHIENNVFELVTSFQTTGHRIASGGAGMGGGGPDFRPNSIFRQVAIRGNVARHVDTAMDIATVATAFGCSDGGALLVEDNLSVLNNPNPIQHSQTVMVSCLNNLTPQGTLIPAYDRATGRSAEFYFPAAEDAFVLAL